MSRGNRTVGKCVVFAAATLVAGAVLAVNTVPFADSFESYGAGSSIVGQNGWSAKTNTYTTVTGLTYTASSGLPLAGAAHTKVVQLATEGDSVSNLVSSSGQGLTNVWIDMMLQMVQWGQDDAPTMVTNDSGIQTAMYLGTNGNLYVWNGVIDGSATFYSNRWTMLSHGAITSGSWHRVTIAMDYLTAPNLAGNNLRFFQIRLDGNDPISSPDAWNDPASISGTGTWFSCANNNGSLNDYLSAAVFSGTGYVDDFVVTNNTPDFTKSWSITSFVNPASKGTISPSGQIQVTDGSSQAYTVTPVANWRVVGIYTNNIATGSSSTNYTWTGISGSGTIEARLDYVRVTNDVPVQWLLDNGLPNNDGGATGDADGDGVPNYKEWAASSDPNNSNSVPMIVTVQNNGTTNIVRWVATGVDSYLPGFVVQKTTNLTAGGGGWTNVWTGPQPRASGTNTYSDTTGPAKAFYRYAGSSSNAAVAP